MTSVAYAIEATTGKYDATAFAYVAGLSDKIKTAADTLGISAAAIAGAMAEENHDYARKQAINDASDQWALLLNNTHDRWAADYTAVGGDTGYAPSAAEKLLHPVYMDLGPANFKMTTAIRLLGEYMINFPSDPLGLGQYTTGYNLLAIDIVNPVKTVTANLYGLMLKEAQTWFESHNAWGSNWAALPQEFKDALYITYVNIGPQKIEDKYTTQTSAGKPYEPMPGLSTAAGMNHLLNAVQVGTAIGDSTYASTALAVNITGEMITTASENTDAGLAYRYALTKLNSVALVGIDYATHNTNGELNLYDPATGTGNLTDFYLADRAAMLSWKMLYDTTDKSYSSEWNTIAISDDWDFIDMGTLVSGTSLKLAIDGVDLTTTDNHQIIFGDGDGNTLTGQSLSDHLYGMDGDDTLTGNAGNDHLEGGIGTDTYVINAGDGNDIILDTDGLGSIIHDSTTLTGGTSTDANHWFDSDNNITYTRINTGTTQDLLVDAGSEHFTIKDFNFATGELGITLTGDTPPPGQTATGYNIYGDLTPYQLPWSLWPLVSNPAWPYMFDPIGNLVRSTSAQPYFADKLFDSAGDDNIYAGDGTNVIFATNGGNNYIESGANDDYITGGNGRDIVLSGGMSDTIDVGGGDDLVFGQAGGDVIDGGPGDDCLVGGGDADAINGGDGNDELYADNVTSWEQAIAGSGTAIAGQGELLSGGAGDDTVIGGRTSDALLGGTGQDSIAGLAGNDVIFGDSRIDFVAPPLREFDAILGALYWPSNTNAINFNSPYTVAPMLNIEIQKIGYGTSAEVKLSSLANPEAARDNWLVSATEGDSDELYGGSGDDWIFGEFGEDILAGGTGDDLLVGGAGNDTYLINAGEGVDTIVDNYKGGETNTIVFGDGIDPAQVTLAGD